MCQKYGINFSGLDDYGIIQNINDKFTGEKITILYDPGFFPAMLSTNLRNDGVPQEGNLKKHLILFEKELEKNIPDKNFSGVGVIDFEHWRPIWRENWGILDKYRQHSIKIEKEKHPFWSKSAIENRVNLKIRNSLNYKKEKLVKFISLISLVFIIVFLRRSKDLRKLLQGSLMKHSLKQ
ncbi:unnamed protein product [Nezara viridula]|uniref:Hyaluronidase n=1 Tax=Nezara viridula TaxID=85310 RepID=A0A9P0MTW9_NEZVI|nr:unnamed protein product [Nezara viridula]